MLNKDIIIKRLALIKLLYKNGVDQSKQSEPICAFSILSLHDSIEMFLKLLTEHKGIKSEKFTFLEYWTNIPTLTLKESMRNFNERRVNIKHKGLLPSKGDVEISRVNATDFFEQNTKMHFDINWNEISLLSLVKFDKPRQFLEEAEKSLETSNFEESIHNSTKSFADLIYQYEDNKGHYTRDSLFFFGKSLGTISFMRIKDPQVEKLAEQLKESIESIQSAIKIMSFGIDYRKYAKFSLLTPSYYRTSSDDIRILGNRKKKWTKENCQYCIDFVVESAIKLQEFDFDINEIEDNPYKQTSTH